MSSQQSDSKSDGSGDNFESSEEKIKFLEAEDSLDTSINICEQQICAFNRIIILRNMRIEIRENNDEQ